MSHQIDTSTGKPAIAYVGETPWHGLGQQLEPGRPIEEWVVAAGMNWEAQLLPTYYRWGDEERDTGERAVVRSDNGVYLATVSGRYKVVQPREVLEFFRDLTEAQGFQLDTAGVLFQGQRFWALARTPHEFQKKGDHVQGYLLLYTSVDGTLATTARFTSIRVVCHNTLSVAALAKGEEGVDTVRVVHTADFDPQAVKDQLGLLDQSWAEFERKAVVLMRKKISHEAAVELITRAVLGITEEDDLPETVRKGSRVVEGIMEAVVGGPGSNWSAKGGSAWDLLNGVTYYADHMQARSPDHRLQRAWFGKYERLKRDVAKRLLELAEAA